MNSAFTFALIPDLVTSKLAQERLPPCEITNASTTQMLALDGNWLPGLTQLTLPHVVPPGIANAKVLRTASHDSASAAVASQIDDSTVFINSGTWSLVGIETPLPYATDMARDLGFTNERGFGGVFRFLKNVMGMWLIERTRGEYSAAECERLAQTAPPFGARFDVNDARFYNPADMRAEIGIAQESAMFRAIFENLAAGYAECVRGMEAVTGRRIERINILGGGSQCSLLNQMTANASNLPVFAGPVEATAIGNALVQFEILGALPHARIEGRALVKESFPHRVFEPKDVAAWQDWLNRR